MKRPASVGGKGVRAALVFGVLGALVVPLGSAHLAVAESEDISHVRLAAATTRLYAADGSVLVSLHGEIDRDPVPLADIPAHLRNAVIAIEDRRFWHHSGIDPRGTIRAFVQNLLPHHQIEGGSTISEQLVKNLYFFGRARTIPRKSEEAILTMGLERLNSKEQILESYLNTAYFGRGVYGVQAAARSYFHTDVRKITVPQAAYLAGLIHAPAAYDWSTSDSAAVQVRKQKAAISRRNEVLGVMGDLHYITRAQEKEMKRSRLAVFPPQGQKWKHPYFVDAVLRELGVLRTSGDQPLDKRFDFLGENATERAQAVYGGGLRIYTTMDPGAQQSAESGINEVLPNGEYKRLDSALVSVQPGTGYVRALVGGRDYYPTGCDKKAATLGQLSQACRIAKVNMALGSIAGGSGRQPGSGFKPFVLAALIESGISLKESVDTNPFTVDFAHGDHWQVDNYEGESQGVVDITDATVHSINAAYAHIETDLLGNGDALVGSRKVAAMARKLGIPFPTEADLRKSCGKAYRTNDTCTPADQVPAIALGAKEVAPIDMAAAYATFAAEGMYAPPTTITKITNADGKVLFRAKPRARRVISRDTALGVDAVLRQVVERGTGEAAALDNRPVAGKTGTSEGWRDAWFNGYTPQLATTVWVGNPIPVQNYDGSWSIESMTPDNGYPLKIVGGTFPAEIWHEDMSAATQGMPVVDFPPAPDKLYGPAKHPVVVNPGPAVPGVVGLNVTEAQITLETAGFTVGVQQVCQQTGNNAAPLTVWGQNVSGRSVTLMVNDAVC
jgi:penicillin-binding protein 1A